MRGLPEEKMTRSAMVRARVTEDTLEFFEAMKEEYGYESDSEIVRLSIDFLKMAINTGFFTREPEFSMDVSPEMRRFYKILEAEKEKALAGSKD